MNVLLLSDSHGHTLNLERALTAQKDCPLVVFLGDGLDDIEKMKARFPERSYIVVKGNCDLMGDAETVAYKFVEGNTLVACHGHEFGVKRSLLPLLEKAESVRANVALYGHTHRSDAFYDSYSGVYAINPGAVALGSYAVLKLSKGKVDVEFKNVFEVRE